MHQCIGCDKSIRVVETSLAIKLKGVISKKVSNMSKVRTQAPAGSYNSATSSENSETQSVEDHQTALSSTNRSAASIR